MIYCLSNPSEEWQGERGYINESMVKKYFPKPESNPYILLCGSAAMVNEAYLPSLKDYNSERIFTY